MTELGEPTLRSRCQSRDNRNCETWEELIAYGDLVLREGSRERRAAECHFAHCPRCARRAFLLDPSWASNRPWGLEHGASVVASDFGVNEIADVKRRVREASRIRGMEDAVHRRSTGARAAIAAAALLLLAAGGALFRTFGPTQESAPPLAEASRVQVRAEAVVDDYRSGSSSALELSLPVVGSLVPAAARVYDFGQEDFALVMVVHETLDL